MKREFDNLPIISIDYTAYSGKWYSLYSIPTLLDKSWRQTIEYYTLIDDDHFDVLTTYHKQGKKEEKSIKSKIFIDKHQPDGEMKAQFIWPFKVGYRIIELPADYSYVVIGHPSQKYLFIMARQPTIDPTLLNEIIDRCSEIGYDTESLVSQEHDAAAS